MSLATAAGCPSGLAPPLERSETQADATAFVRTDAKGLDRIELMVDGAKCAGCIKKIESGLLALPGVADARLNLSTGRLIVGWSGGAARAREIVETLARLGYSARAFDAEDNARRIDTEGRALLRRLAVAGFAMMNIMMFSVPVWSGADEMGEGTRGLMHWLSAVIAVPATFYAAQPFFASAWRALKRGRANMDVPISLGVALTLGMSLVETMIGGAHAYFDGVTMLLFLLLIGRYLDHRLRERARSAARDLLAMQAVTASRVEADGTIRAVAAREIEIGDTLSLAAGDRVPVDGTIISGVSDIDLSILTGETAPAAARAGDALPAGAVNLTRAITMRAERRMDDSTVAELARLIEAGEQTRSRAVRIAERAAQFYVPTVHTLAGLTLVGWLVGPAILRALGIDAPDAGLRTALTNAIAVLIITCPCALGLAVPAVQVVATGRLFKRGVFVKSGDALERLAQIDSVVLDKTGTLTLGRPELVGPVDPDMLARAAALARASRHPLSRALVEAAGPGAAAAAVSEHPGAGLQANIDGVLVRLGSMAFVGATARDDRGDPAEAELWFREGDVEPVRFSFRDALRPDAVETIAALKKRGLPVTLMSGDRPSAVATAAAATGIADWRAGQSPQDKLAALHAALAQGGRPFMIGDGLNDAAALAGAHASASPGSAIGASQAAADIVFQGARLSPLIEAYDVARAAHRRVFENLAFSALYNVIAAPIAILGFVTPLVAAAAMSISSLVVTLNALRLAGGDRS